MAPKKFFPTLFQHLATDTARNLIVSAGAGAGKTAVLTRRIIKILREEKISLNRLMVVTFTEKAAVEMKQRVYQAIDEEIGQSGDEHFKKMRDDFLENRISTFHAFCASLLREYPIEAQIDPYFRVMDETDKIFFLRRILDKTISEFAEQKENADLMILCRDWSKSVIINSIYTLIQKREDTGNWLHAFQELNWEDYRHKIENYRLTILREICYKLSRSTIFADILKLLKETCPIPEDDTSKLSLRRLKLIELIPEFMELLETAKDPNKFGDEEIIFLGKKIVSECKLIGVNAKAWADNPDNLDQLKMCFMTIRNVIQHSQLDSYEINWQVEEEGFELSQALARITVKCLKAYNTEKEKEHYLDFQDLQLKVLRLLSSTKHKAIVEELRNNFLYIMVDEFQDTNSLQWDIIKLIASDDEEKLFGDRLFIVGDEKQAIYSFRGGDVTLFTKVKKQLIETNQFRNTHQQPFQLSSSIHNEKNYQQDYEQMLSEDHQVKAGEIIFSDNFRSGEQPISFFNLFFEKLMGQDYYEDYEARPQRLVCAANKRDSSVELLLVNPDPEKQDESLSLFQETEDMDAYTKEAHLIAMKIKQVLAGDDPQYDYIREQVVLKKPAIAVLLNRRTKLKVYEEALRRESIDFIVVRGRGFFQRQEIVDLGNLLGFLINPDNSIYLAGFLRSPIGHIPDDALFLLSQLDTGENLWEKLCWLCEQTDNHAEDFSEEHINLLKYAHKLLNHWRYLSRRMPLIDLLRTILDEGSFYATLGRGNRGDQAISNIEKFLEHAREASLSGQDNIITFTEWLNERINHVEEEGEADVDIELGGAVQLMTVHQSKGLEFPMVFVPDLTAYFNFGERETLCFDEIALKIDFEDDGSILRQNYFEVGLDALDPENKFEPTPTLIKRIIEKQNRQKIIAEKKRLFYVAATRAMDHLILVGQLKKSSSRSLQEIEATPLNHLTNWMDWLYKIMKLNTNVKDQFGKIKLHGDKGESITIPYHVFDEKQSMLTFSENFRTEFHI